MWVVIGIIGLIISLALMAGANKQHKEEMGVNMPSRNAMKRIRRNAREKGTSEQAAYEQWLRNKQRREPRL